MCIAIFIFPFPVLGDISRSIILNLIFFLFFNAVIPLNNEKMQDFDVIFSRNEEID